MKDKLFYECSKIILFSHFISFMPCDNLCGVYDNLTFKMMTTFKISHFWENNFTNMVDVLRIILSKNERLVVFYKKISLKLNKTNRWC